MLQDGDKLLCALRYKMWSLFRGWLQFPSSHVYDGNLSVNDYLSRAGGTKKQADTDRIYVIKANGSVMLPGDSWFGGRKGLEPGDTIVVPVDSDYLDNLSIITSANAGPLSIGCRVECNQVIASFIWSPIQSGGEGHLTLLRSGLFMAQVKEYPPLTLAMNGGKEDEIDLRELFAVLWRGKWWIVASTLVGAAIAVVVAIITAKYSPLRGFACPLYGAARRGACRHGCPVWRSCQFSWCKSQWWWLGQDGYCGRDWEIPSILKSLYPSTSAGSAVDGCYQSRQGDR